nr:UDP-glucose/GDP-mannose dehydrogenase family protein [Chelativorans alearense]
MQIAMIGAGYVGLTTATCFAEMGHEVACHDVDGERIRQLEAGELPIYEPRLEEAMRRAVASGKLRFSRSGADCVGGADIVFLAVGTPATPDGRIDLSQVEAAARLVSRWLKPGAVVAIKSTVVAGTCRRVREIMAEERQSLDFSVAANPEFLREGSAMEDFLCPDRIVIGCDDRRSASLLSEVYRPLTERGAPKVLSSTPNAELIKYAANAFLALKIGFINEVADLCAQTGADVGPVAEGIGLDRRIGPSFLRPGPGYGGSCFPKDTCIFAATGHGRGARQFLIETLIERNEKRKVALARRVIAQGELREGSVVAVLGLAFKANTDDVREAAALTMVPILQKAGLRVRAHDPKARANARQWLRDVEWTDTPYEAAHGADAVVILTEWEEYKNIDLGRLACTMSQRVVFDYRNLLDPRAVAAHGLTYFSLGRPPVSPVGKSTRGRVSALAGSRRRVAAPARD